MDIPITQTKIIVPRRRADILTRQRLIDLLYELLDYKLIVITAPAGYGKTSLLVDFAHHTEIPVCWFSIDEFDRDPQRFIAHFIAAITERFQSFGAQSQAAVASSSQAHLDLGWLVTSITNDAFENIREHFLFVLDDYHLVNENKDIDYFINRFVQVVDENCHLIISSRSLLSLQDMPLIVARSQVAGLSFEELAFKSDEIQTLVFQNQKINLSQTTAEELARETEGWITGLLLSAHSFPQGMADKLRLARVSGVNLYDYLAQQVLDRQPPEVRDFLLHTSFLEEFDVDLCVAVFGPGDDYGKLLDYVLQNNLFVLPVGDDGRWLRYHHLFRDFLQARLSEQCPEDKDYILSRLADIYTERKEWEKAYATYRRRGDTNATVSLIERAGSPLLAGGRLGLLVEWIDALPGDVLASRPRLLSLRGTAAVIQGKTDHGLSLLNRAEEALRPSSDTPNYALTLVRRAMTYRFLGNYQASLDDAEKALELTSNTDDSRAIQAEALRAIGMNKYQMGQINDAIQKLSEALKAYQEVGDRQNVAMLLMELGLAYMSTGRYKQALAYYEDGLDYWRDMRNRIREATLLNNLGVLHHLMGNYERAASLYEEGLIHAKQNGYARMEAYILCGMGDLYTDLGAINAALDAYTRARSIAQQIDYRFLLLYINLAEAAQARRKNDLEHARELMRTAERIVRDSKSDFERGLWHMESGHLCVAEGRYQDGIDHFTTAVDIFDKGGHQVEASRAYLYLASGFQKGGDPKSANEYLTRAFKVSSNLESQHILVVVGKETKQLLEYGKNAPSTRRSATHLLKQVSQFEEDIPAIRRRLRPHTNDVPFIPPKLSIYAFGRSQVELDGKTVDAPEWLKQRKVKELLYFILANRNGLTKDEIGGELWKDSSPAELKLAFKNTIYRLRHALGQDVISFDEDRYWFNSNLDYEYDVESFLKLIREAKEAVTKKEKVDYYLRAIEYCQGTYLPDVDGAWVLVEREKLWRLFVEANLKLANIYLEDGDYSATIEHCQQVLNADPCLEEAHRMMMLAYAGKGNRAAVTRQYEQCRQALLEEVNAQPSPQTAELYEALKS